MEQGGKIIWIIFPDNQRNKAPQEWHNAIGGGPQWGTFANPRFLSNVKMKKAKPWGKWIGTLILRGIYSICMAVSI
jgi:hypothetical protein